MTVGARHAVPAGVRRRGEPRGQRLAGPALTPALLRPADALALQQRAGNRVVLGTLSSGRVRRLQRQETGLKESGATTTFVTAGLAFWKDAVNKDKPLSDYATHLMAKANAALKAIGSFEVKSDMSGTGAASASFDRVAWNIAINTSLFSSRSAITKVGQLSLDEAAEIADTIWHEMRHSEQYFRIARMRAALSTKKTAAEIAKELMDGMSIPADVALAAAGAPLKAVKGTHSLGPRESLRSGRRQRGDRQEPRNDEGRARGVRDVVDQRRGPRQVRREPHHGNRGDRHEVPARQSGPQAPQGDQARAGQGPGRVEGRRGQLGQGHRRAEARSPPGHAVATQQFDTALYAAYRDHLHEKDAWEAGVAVGKEFRKQGATK